MFVFGRYGGMLKYKVRLSLYPGAWVWGWSEIRMGARCLSKKGISGWMNRNVSDSKLDINSFLTSWSALKSLASTLWEQNFLSYSRPGKSQLLTVVIEGKSAIGFISTTAVNKCLPLILPLPAGDRWREFSLSVWSLRHNEFFQGIKCNHQKRN